MRELLLLASVVSLQGCGEPSCETVHAHAAACGLRWDLDFCAGEYNQCFGRCILASDCGQLLSDDASLRYCAAGCGGDFVCDGGQTAISSRWRCDGEIDCRDAADEAACEGARR